MCSNNVCVACSSSVPYWIGEHEYQSEGNPYQHTQFNIKYEFPATVYYNRTMTKDKWNTICLPIALKGSQVRATFGSDCILSEFIGISHNQKSLLVFRPVDLDTEGLIAGKPYIIKPTRDPDYTDTEHKYEIQVGNGGTFHNVKLDAPLYFIAGVTKGVTLNDDFINLPENKKVTDNNPPAGEPSITFQGSLYRKILTPEEVKQREYWMITKGTMYHLNGDYPHTIRISETESVQGYAVWGTYCYLHADKVDESTGAKTYNIGLINEDGDITAIEVEGLEVPGSKIIDNNSVYTLNGQKIGGQGNLNSLSKGIYIVNGKKYVVK